MVSPAHILDAGFNQAQTQARELPPETTPTLEQLKRDLEAAERRLARIGAHRIAERAEIEVEIHELKIAIISNPSCWQYRTT